jgi:hypothetical protein
VINVDTLDGFEIDAVVGVAERPADHQRVAQPVIGADGDANGIEVEPADRFRCVLVAKLNATGDEEAPAIKGSGLVGLCRNDRVAIVEVGKIQAVALRILQVEPDKAQPGRGQAGPDRREPGRNVGTLDRPHLGEFRYGCIDFFTVDCLDAVIEFFLWFIEPRKHSVG